MSCSACILVRQLVYNMLLGSDLALNLLLMGNPRETVSKRTSRARAAGSRAAAVFCSILTWIGNRFGANRDHCTWAASGGASIGGEIWHWSKPDTSDTGNG